MDILRRSSRNKSKKNNLEWDRCNFCVKRVEEVDGRGVFATSNFQKGSYLLPYEGTLCLEDPNKEDETFIFQFSCKGKTYWIDASFDDGSLGRLINDDHIGPNCIAKPLVGDTPGIGFFALKDITEGNELRYCYGNKNEDYPWRRQKHNAFGRSHLLWLIQGTKKPDQSATKTPLVDQSATKACPPDHVATRAPPLDKSATRAPPLNQSAAREPPLDQPATSSSPLDHLATRASLDKSAKRTPPPDKSATTTPRLDQSATSSPLLDQPGSRAPPYDHSATTMPPLNQSVISSPPLDQSAARAPPYDNSATTMPPLNQSATSSPPLNQSATSSPPLDQSAARAPPYDNSATTMPRATSSPPLDQSVARAPPYDNSATTMPPLNQSAISSPPLDQSAARAPPYDNSATTMPPLNQSATSSPPLNQSATSSPPLDQSAARVPPYDNSETTMPHLNQSATSSPPLDQSAARAPPYDNSATTMPRLDQSATSSPPLDQSVTRAPPYDNSATTMPPLKQSAISSPPLDQSAARAPPCDNSATTMPPLNQSATSSPPLNQSATSSPPLDQSAARAPPYDNSATTMPHLNHSAISSPPLDQSAARVPPYDNSATTMPPLNQSATSSPPLNQSATSSPPLNQSATSSPPLDQSVAREPPYDNSATTTPPLNQSATSSPPLDQSVAREPPYDNSATTTPPLNQSATSSPPLDQSVAREPPYDNSATTTPPLNQSATSSPPLNQSVARAPPFDNSATTTPHLDQSATSSPPLDHSAARAPPYDNSATTMPPLDQSAVSGTPGIEIPISVEIDERVSVKRKRKVKDNQPKDDYWSDSVSSCQADSEDEYIPDSESDSDSTSSSGVFPALTISSISDIHDADTVSSTTDFEKQSQPTHHIQDLAETVFPENGATSSTTSEVSHVHKLPSVMVASSNNGDTGRVYDKRFYCLYCRKPQAKLPRHLLSQHAEELEVQEYKAETSPKTKAKILCKLRNLGNHLHNSQVLRDNCGILAVVYRTLGPHTFDDYVPCQYCLGYCVYWDLWKHMSRCLLKPDEKSSQGRVVANSRLLLSTPVDISVGLQGVLATLNSDSISRIVKSDQLIVQLGEKMFLKLGHDRENYSTIRNTLRELGRIVKNLRESIGPKEANLASFIKPGCFKAVLRSAREISGFSEETHMFATPSLALKLGHSLKKCANILKGNALQVGDEELLKASMAFYDLCEMEWTDEVSTHALRTLGENKRNKVLLVPLTSDCQALSFYLKDTGMDAYNTLQVNPSNKDAWADLAGITLTQLVVFNRRRQGEVSRMTKSDFHGKHTAGQSDITETLSPLEQKLCSTLTRIEIVGKRGRTVPVIMTNEVKERVNLLIETRDQVGVNKENVYVFARLNSGSLGHIRACDSLRHFSEECGAKQPKLLRSTKLRKQIATLSQVLNLKENELDILANFLGHDVRVHREFYRLPESTLQVAKVSKLLFSLENGQFSQQRGKSLDEVTVENDEDIDVEIEAHEASEESEEDEVVQPPRKRSSDKISMEHGEGQHSQRKLPKTTDGRRNVVRRAWSENEKAAVMRHFARQVHLHQLPAKKDIDLCKAQESVLERRSWRNIKDFIRNSISSLKSKRK